MRRKRAWCPGPSRVLDDISDRVLEVTLRLGELVPVALAEQVVDSLVRGIEVAGVEAVEVAHAAAQVVVDAEHQVVVVAHEAVREDVPVEPRRRHLEQRHERDAIVIGQEDRLLVVPPRDDVVVAGTIVARLACHCRHGRVETRATRPPSHSRREVGALPFVNLSPTCLAPSRPA
jgi:hypothetical protein